MWILGILSQKHRNMGKSEGGVGDHDPDLKKKKEKKCALFLWKIFENQILIYLNTAQQMIIYVA